MTCTNLADAASEPQARAIIENHPFFYAQGRPYVEPPSKFLADPRT